jgi:hypothetical protein
MHASGIRYPQIETYHTFLLGQPPNALKKKRASVFVREKATHPTAAAAVSSSPVVRVTAPNHAYHASS